VKPRVLLVVPPTASIDRPSLGVHVLQACARAAGYEVEVLYANMLFAARVGERQYENFGRMPMTWLIGPPGPRRPRPGPRRRRANPPRAPRLPDPLPGR
jgi:hypothetical protein